MISWQSRPEEQCSRAEEVWNERRAEVIDELVTPESICHDDSGPVVGPQGFREQKYTPFLAAIPDFHFSIETMIAQGDQVAVRWTMTARRFGDGVGFKTPSEPVCFRGITWVRVRGGKLMEGWQFSNMAEVIRRLAEKAARE